MKYNLEKEIRIKGLKATPARLAILKVLFKIKHPLMLQDMHKNLKNIDLVTLYRTLGSFEKNGLIRRVDLHKDAIYYELNIEHHHHIVCIKCGLVEDFKLCNINHLTKKIITKSLNFKKINEHSFELFGICNACVKN